MKTILINPETHFWRNRMFAIDDERWNLDKRFIPMYELKRRLLDIGYELKTFDMGDPLQAERIIITDIPPKQAPHYSAYKTCLDLGLQERLICLLMESPVIYSEAWDHEQHTVFPKVITWNDDLIDNQKYFKLCYPQPSFDHVPFVPFAERKLCTMIASNRYSHHPYELYSERLYAIGSLQRLIPDQFDLYGTGWNVPVTRTQYMFPFLVPRFSCYRGPVLCKVKTLAKYKFCICYENMIGRPGFSGYITEKIHHCFMAGCVPVYLGANNIETYIPSNTFINRRQIPSYEKLMDMLLQIDEAEFMAYLKHAQEYLDSPSFQDRFSVEAYVHRMVTYLTQ